MYHKVLDLRIAQKQNEAKMSKYQQLYIIFIDLQISQEQIVLLKHK